MTIIKGGKVVGILLNNDSYSTDIQFDDGGYLKVKTPKDSNIKLEQEVEVRIEIKTND